MEAGIEYCKCYKCKRVLELNYTNFYKNGGKSSGFGTECKDCRKTYQKIRNQELRDLRAQFVIEQGLKCNDCGITNDNPSFFDLDHIIPFRFTNFKTRWFLRDRENLQVLCPNCHRIKCINEGFAKRKNINEFK